MTATANYPDSFAFVPTDDLITIIDRIEAVLLARLGVRRDRLTLVPDLSDSTRSGGTAA